MKFGKMCLCAVLLCAVTALSGCSLRSRVLPADTAGQASLPNAGSASPSTGDSAADEALCTQAAGPSNEPSGDLSDEPDPNAPSVHDSSAERREYRAHVDAELTEGADGRLLPTGQDADAGATVSDRADSSDGLEADHADRTATELLTQQEAERLGVSEEAPRADSVYQFYQTLLNERVGSLFECKRLYVYWETSVEYQTVFKTSPEHEVIRTAGGYDAAAKRQADALTVDDGWIERKSPDCIVKGVEASVLGQEVHSTRAAQRVLDALCSRPGWRAMNTVQTQTVLLLSQELLDTRWGRLAAALYLAQVMYPDAMSDVDTDEALRLLSQEATGAELNGVFAYR